MPASNTYRVGIVGGGAWGTALSVIAHRAGSRVTLVTRNTHVIQSIESHRRNEIYLPAIHVDSEIRVTDKPAEACRADLLIIAVPSHTLRGACIILSDMLDEKVPILIATKGIERGSLMLMSELAADLLPRNTIGALSGPNFAEEAARGMPTATTIASADETLLALATAAIGGKLFRPYTTDDIMGTQIGGAVKNVIAIACGIAAGKGMGENTRAAIVTRGFAETARFAAAKGGRYETLMGLSGLGDLLLTATSPTSRNFSFGLAVGQRQNRDDVFRGRGRTAVEGVATAESLHELAQKHHVDMPICDAVYRILYESADIDHVIADLLDRPFAHEGV